MSTATTTPDQDVPDTDPIKGSEGGVSNPATLWIVRVIVVSIVLVWLIPAVGLLITSIRIQSLIETTGWWTAIPNLFDASQWTLGNYQEVLTTGGFDSAFVNTLVVSVPATIMPITIAAFAAYAFSWMEFKGRFLMFATIVGLMAVPLQVALIPLQRLYSGFDMSLPFMVPIVSALSPWDAEQVLVGIPLQLNGTFLGVWLAHTGFGLPLAIYLLRNYIGSLPSELIESARIDGADHYQIFTRLIIPLSVPALASFAIFQFLWVFNDYLVAFIFLGTGEGNQVLTIALQQLNGAQTELVEPVDRRRVHLHDRAHDRVLLAATLLRPRHDRGRREGLTLPARSSTSRRWLAIALATVVVTISFWALAYGTAVLFGGETLGGGTTNVESTGVLAIGLSLSSVPLAFLLAAWTSRRVDWPIGTLAAMGLAIAVGLPLLIVRNPLAALLSGFAAGAVVCLDRPEGTTWHYRAIAAAIVSLVALGGMSVEALFLPLAALGPALPFSAMGAADALAPRASWASDPE